MATPLLKIILPSTRYRQETFPFKFPIGMPVMATKLSFLWLERSEDRKRTRIKRTVPSKNDDCLVSDLDREKEKEYEEITIRQPKRRLADTWPEIHGADDWADMLDPLDALLQSELIRYGEMAQACYDAFDSEPLSKYCGTCKYMPTKFFECLGLTQHGYEVTSYIYAAYNINLPHLFQRSVHPEAWSQTTNWIGYVAVSNDKMSTHLGRRDITIAWRGTMTRQEWIEDFKYFLKPISLKKIPCPDPRVRVEDGFLDLYTNEDKSCQFCKHSAREQILAEVKRLIQQYKDENLSITITGHSLGSALAIISAYDIAETGIDVKDNGQAVPMCVFSFSGPRVGNIRFKNRLTELGVKVLRVVNIHDKVPKAPGIFFNESIPPVLQKLGETSLWLYSHVGVELALDHKNSPFLKETSDWRCFHNLEAHLHLLDGYYGKGQTFSLTSGRDIALVNKGSDFLKNHYLVPPNWRQCENKGLVRNHKGYWEQPERPNFRDYL